ncbi:GSU2403 family nucleotidyltransferase fold protein [Roseinatronobacter alkalisoli]|uniref:GSU2403 family nucleotidyltransferase fold protein n=1 Tax=Roseinatronobacter alkalisoli TaxID=3028235 RepID=UPI003B67B37B
MVPAIARALPSVIVQTPRPDWFAFHKLIVVERHRQGHKQANAWKDRAPSVDLIDLLAQDSSDDLRGANQDVCWREWMHSSLSMLQDTAAVLHGRAQAPNKKRNRAAFAAL